MHLLDLFSGIGGFAYAAKLANLEIEEHYYSDVATYPLRVYAKNFPDAKPLGDVRQIDGHKLRQEHPGNWLVTGGFPCQDISNRGKKAGIEGERSGLWGEMHRVINELQPAFVLAENVAALTYRGLDTVLRSLGTIGYDAEWNVISASSLGAPHQRERLWIVAYPSSATDTASHGCVGRMEQPLIFRRDMGTGEDASTQAKASYPWVDWQADISARQVAGKPLVRRKDHGLSQWVERNTGLGNAIVPQVAAEVLKLLPRWL